MTHQIQGPLAAGFGHIEAQEKASKDLEEWRKNAEHARKDIVDSMVLMTRQVQGQLSDADVQRIKALVEASADPKLPYLHQDLAIAKAMINDALTLSIAISTALVLDASGRPAFAQVPVDAISQLKEIVERLQRSKPRPDLGFEFKVHPRFADKLVVTKQVFLSVFYSVFHNALKYAAPGRVEVECGFEGALATVKVKNLTPTGYQILRSDESRIFDKFGKGSLIEHSGRFHEYSLGLGLWIAKTLLKEFGGDIWLELDRHFDRRMTNEQQLVIFVVRLPEEWRTP